MGCREPGRLFAGNGLDLQSNGSANDEQNAFSAWIGLRVRCPATGREFDDEMRKGLRKT